MAKSSAAADKPDVSPGAEPQSTITLNEFCLRLSTRVKRVELIGAFEHAERAADKANDTEAAYQARFDAFIKKPA
ncbi:hypothetical protein K32_49310 [Kaistia sp. 32K]|uniref:hypothetical protein n=1 Tax=Kaistia sp. 32K TaxID=2795690 RepID=UPI0019166B60|nr:hypothetical protein [Kaistia sp. 32K]BCP56314.1 hypothetical protein K32_49310 [Kaistia sp. 32K]